MLTLVKDNRATNVKASSQARWWPWLKTISWIGGPLSRLSIDWDAIALSRSNEYCTRSNIECKACDAGDCDGDDDDGDDDDGDDDDGDDDNGDDDDGDTKSTAVNLHEVRAIGKTWFFFSFLPNL